MEFLLGLVFLMALVAFIAKMFGGNTRKTKAERPSTTKSSGAERLRPAARHVSFENRSVEEAREAWLSGDLQRMINALDSKASLVDRHFLLQTVVQETYRLRSEPRMADKCLEVAQTHCDEFSSIVGELRTWSSESGHDLPRVSTFQHYATLLTERGEFDRAIQVCESAIGFGLDDGTKGGYAGRIERIKKKAAARTKTPRKAVQKESASDGGSPDAKIIESNTRLVVARDSFSQHHRRRRRPIDAEVFQLEDVPFIPLPRAPLGREERDAGNRREVESEAKELFELVGQPDWEMSDAAKLSPNDRPDPAFRLHFSAQSGTFLVDDRGRAKSHRGAPAAVLSFDASGGLLAERPLAWGLYRLQVNPMGRGLIGVSSDQVLHCYDENLNCLDAFPLTETPELTAARARLGITEREMHTHIRTAALRPDGGAYLFSVVDEAFAFDMQGQPQWGVRMPHQEGWSKVGTMTQRSGTSDEIEQAMATLGLFYPVTADEIKRQYRELAKQWHPDKNPGREEQVASGFRKVASAAELLSGLDLSEISAPGERTIYEKPIGEAYETSIGDSGVTLSVSMSIGGDERSVADWIYATSFNALGGAFLAGYSGKIVETDAAGRPLRLFDTGSVPRRIADTGDYLYFLTDTRLYVIRGTTLCRVVDVFDKGELVVGQTGFGLFGGKAFRWYTEDGNFVGGICSRHPLRRIYPTGQGWNVETRQHRTLLSGVPSWLEDSVTN
jgi:hypothetical protein